MTDTNRGSLGRTPRIRNLNVESQQDFVRGVREWFLSDMDKVVAVLAEQLRGKIILSLAQGLRSFAKYLIRIR